MEERRYIMPDLGELRMNFKNEDVKEGDVVTFMNKGKIEEVDFSKAQDRTALKTVFQIDIQLPNGGVKTLTPNSSTRKSLSKVYTTNSDNWEGKKAKVTFVKQAVFGEIKDVLVLEPIDEK